MSGSAVDRRVRRRRCLVSLLAAGAGLHLAGARAEEGEPAKKGDLVHLPAVTALDGTRLPLDTLRGTALILVFFSTTCPYCHRHNQRIQALVDAVRGKPLRVIGVAEDRQAEPVRAYLQAHGYTFDVTLDAERLRAPLTRRHVMPLTCVIDRQGRLREVIPGEMSADDVQELAHWADAA